MFYVNRFNYLVLNVHEEDENILGKKKSKVLEQNANQRMMYQLTCIFMSSYVDGRFQYPEFKP
ncbi:hypothetical protein BLOT_004948 [Blomia tropicalis]|nr:hypothetical protein BLOT_004948 [Blomia tropicalis]